MLLSKINKFFIVLVFTQLLSACMSLPLLYLIEKEKTAIELPKNFEKAISAAKNGRPTDAIKLFTEVTTSNPSFSPAYTNLGLQYLKINQQINAEKSLRTAISLNPDDAVACNHLGIILRQQGKFSHAKHMYKKAIESKIKYANAHLNIGMLYDIYLFELPLALEHYESYQTITKNSDKLVSKWIIDLKRRIARNKKKES